MAVINLVVIEVELCTVSCGYSLGKREIWEFCTAVGHLDCIFNAMCKCTAVLLNDKTAIDTLNSVEHLLNYMISMHHYQLVISPWLGEEQLLFLTQ